MRLKLITINFQALKAATVILVAVQWATNLAVRVLLLYEKDTGTKNITFVIFHGNILHKKQFHLLI